MNARLKITVHNKHEKKYTDIEVPVSYRSWVDFANRSGFFAVLKCVVHLTPKHTLSLRFTSVDSCLSLAFVEGKNEKITLNFTEGSYLSITEFGEYTEVHVTVEGYEHLEKIKEMFTLAQIKFDNVAQIEG